ncbi:MAG: hypothetical protein E6G44_10885 [Actinobacteria bacterium]|nr:MAG: hypothetical protein E6G44_10885 [Actinomycetota bacterium]
MISIRVPNEASQNVGSSTNAEALQGETSSSSWSRTPTRRARMGGMAFKKSGSRCHGTITVSTMATAITAPAWNSKPGRESAVDGTVPASSQSMVAPARGPI